MSLVIVPGDNFYYKYNGTEGTETIYQDPEDPTSPIVVDLEQDEDYLKYSTQVLTPSYEAYFYAKFPNGENIAVEKQIWANIRSSIMPSQFDVFELYLEDGNGKKATIRMTDDDMGIRKMFILSSMVKDKNFNTTYVTKIGVHFKGCSDPTLTNLSIVVNSYALNSSIVPHYCQPQEVADFMRLTNNDGTRMIIDDSSPITYDTLADIISQAEDFIEQETRTSWTEKREIGELRDLSTASSQNGLASTPYIGLFQPTGLNSPALPWFRGYWVQLVHKDIKPLDKTKGDKLEIRWMGNQWNDITPSGDDTTSVWYDPKKGGLYIRQYFIQRDASVRVTYRYGRDEAVPRTIKRVALLFCAKHIIETGQLYSFLFPEAGEYEDRWSKVALSYGYQIKDLLRAYVDQTVIGGI